MTKKIVYQIDPSLAHRLSEAKEKLDEAKRAVIDVESDIWIAVEKVVGKIPDTGTIHATGVSIETGFNDRWSQEKLTELEQTWVRKSNLPFPFKKELKAMNKDISYIRENAPDAYLALAEALVRNPAKPSFTLADKE